MRRFDEHLIALYRPRLFPSAEQYSDEDRDDPDDNEQFDKSKRFAPPARSARLNRPCFSDVIRHLLS